MTEQHLNSATIAWLCKKFDLQPPDDFCQDWEGEIASPSLIGKCLDVYEEGKLTDAQKAGVMALLLPSMNAAIAEGIEPRDAWDRIEALLKNNIVIHRELVEEWSSWEHSEEEINDAFEITPRLRKITTT